MKGSCSVLFNVDVELGFICSPKQNFLLPRNKLLPCQQCGFLRSEETVILNNSQHLMCIGVGVAYDFEDTRDVVDGNHTCNGRYYGNCVML